MNDFNIYKKLFAHDIRVRFNIPIKNIKKAIILAPHPDDETIGCAGIISLLHNKGTEITIVLATDDENDDNPNARMEEFYSSINKLKCNSIKKLGFKDGQLENNLDSLKEKLKEIICKEEPQVIFTPYILDLHPDHKSLTKILADIVECMNTHIIMYEVWVPILYPNYYIDISEVYEQKYDALECYKSQERLYHIIERSEALNKLRAALLMKRKTTYVEAFKGFSAEDFVKLIHIINDKEML